MARSSQETVLLWVDSAVRRLIETTSPVWRATALNQHFLDARTLFTVGPQRCGGPSSSAFLNSSYLQRRRWRLPRKR